MLNGVNSYEEILSHPEKEIFNWTYLSVHPEAKHAIWERYTTDSVFKNRIDIRLSESPSFSKRFEACFKSYIETDKIKSR